MTTWRKHLQQVAEREGMNTDEWWAQYGPLDIDPDEPHFMLNPLSPGTPCPDEPHRGPQGPNEDISQCQKCGSPCYAMRPAGEEFGGHLHDCSLPQRHESWCQPGGDGHPAPEGMRG